MSNPACRRLRAAATAAIIAAGLCAGTAAAWAGTTATVAGATTVAGAPTTAPAGGSTPTRHGRILGIKLQHRSAQRSAHYETRVCAGCSPPLLAGGGSVMGTPQTPGETTVSALYWAPGGFPLDPSYTHIIDTYLTDVARASGDTANVYAVTAQYYPGASAATRYLIHFGGEIDAANPYPTDGCRPSAGYAACLTDDQLQAQLTAVLAAKALPSDLSHVYALFLPPGVETCDGTGACSDSTFCGYHSNFAISGRQTLYADMPYPQIDGCGSGEAPSGNAAADTAIDTLSHEVNETITDPLGDGWADSAGNEIGDECNGIYGQPLGATDPSNAATTEFNQVIAGGHFYTQAEFSNGLFASDPSQGCALGSAAAGPAAPANKVAVSPSPASVPNDGTSTSTIAVSVVTPSGQPAPGDHVKVSVFSKAGHCGSVTPPQATTTAQGTASFTYTASTDNIVCKLSVSEDASGQVGTGSLSQGNPPPPPALTRSWGSNRVETATAVSRHSFPVAGSAHAGVLASSATFPDALAGGPLAVHASGPLLLTDPAGLDSAAGAELSRALPSSATVYLLGGTAALSASVDQAVRALGLNPVRLAGADRFETAVMIAHAIGDPSTVLEATGSDFPDALAGGAAASTLHGVVLLTSGDTQSGPTGAYIAAHPGAHYALGGPASAADRAATPIVGQDRFDTAALVAQQFFPTAKVVGLASGVNFPDALAGEAEVGRSGGPMLLTNPATLPASTASALQSEAGTLTALFVYGGAGAISDLVASAAQDAA